MRDTARDPDESDAQSGDPVRREGGPVREPVGTEPAGEAAGVPSPCVQVCQLDESRSLCVACLRTLDEIAAWPQMSEDRKRAVLAELERRRPPGPARRTEAG